MHAQLTTHATKIESYLQILHAELAVHVTKTTAPNLQSFHAQLTNNAKKHMTAQLTLTTHATKTSVPN